MALTADYNSYFQGYIALADHEPVISSLESSRQQTIDLLSALNEIHWSFAYAEGKWSIKDVLQHITDTERVMSYRALCFARGLSAGLPGFDEDLFVANAEADQKNSEKLMEEFLATRMSTLSMFRSFNAKYLSCSGSFDQRDSLTVEQLGYLISGHNRHHLTVIRDRYLTKVSF